MAPLTKKTVQDNTQTKHKL